MQIDFYLLAKTQAADKHHFACRLAARARKQNMTVFMRAADATQTEALDKLLWTFSQDAFIPHAVCAANSEPHDVARFPVQLGCESAPPNCCGLLISLNTAAAEDYAQFERVAEIILTGDAADKAAARDRFRFYREQGAEPRTHNIT